MVIPTNNNNNNNNNINNFNFDCELNDEEDKISCCSDMEYQEPVKSTNIPIVPNKVTAKSETKKE